MIERKKKKKTQNRIILKSSAFREKSITLYMYTYINITIHNKKICGILHAEYSN